MEHAFLYHRILERALACVRKTVHCVDVRARYYLVGHSDTVRFWLVQTLLALGAYSLHGVSMRIFEVFAALCTALLYVVAVTHHLGLAQSAPNRSRVEDGAHHVFLETTKDLDDSLLGTALVHNGRPCPNALTRVRGLGVPDKEGGRVKTAFRLPCVEAHDNGR